MKRQYLFGFIIVVVFAFSTVSPVSAHDGVEHTSAVQAVIHQATPRPGFLQFFKNLFSKKQTEVPAVITTDIPVLSPQIKIEEQKISDQEIAQLEVQLANTTNVARIQDKILQNPILNKIVPTSIVSESTSWKTIEEFDRLLAKIAEKSPTKALEFIERRKVVGEKQLLKTPVTKISKKNITIDISHFDYDKSDKADYFGTYVDGRVLRTVFSEQFRGLGGEYKIAELSGYQFGNNVLITQMSGFEQAVDNLSEKALGQLQTGQVRKSTYKVLVLLVDYLDSDPPQQLTNAQTAHNILFNGDLHDFFYEQSYGKMNIVGDVYGWYTLQSNAEGTYCNPILNTNNGNWPQFYNQELMGHMVDDSIQVTSYDHILVIANCKNATGGGFPGEMEFYSTATPRLWWSALGFTYSGQNIPMAVVKTSDGNPSLHFMAHEMGHKLYNYKDTYGLNSYPHANSLDCGNQTLSLSGCEEIEYGNYFDAMGSWQTFSNHYRAIFKETLGWFDPSQILSITESGIYTLSPLEGQAPGEVLSTDTSLPSYRMAKVHSLLSTYPLYILELRKGIGFDSNLNSTTLFQNTNGIFIYKNTYDSLQSNLLDMSPNQTLWDEDVKHVTLEAGTTYTDSLNGIKIETVSVNSQNATIRVTHIPIVNCDRHPATNPGPVLVNNTDLFNETPPIGFIAEYAYKFNIYNNDTIGCNIAHFRVTASVEPPLVLSSLYNAALDIQPGISSGPNDRTHVLFLVPEGVAPGVYHLTVYITNHDSGQITTRIIPVTVN